MDNQQQAQIDIKQQPPKRKYWKFVLGFLGIIIIVGGGFFCLGKIFQPAGENQSGDAKKLREVSGMGEKLRKSDERGYLWRQNPGGNFTDAH